MNKQSLNIRFKNGERLVIHDILNKIVRDGVLHVNTEHTDCLINMGEVLYAINSDHSEVALDNYPTWFSR